MKFTIELKPNWTRTVEVFAPNRDQALKAALQTNPGHTAEWVVELNEEGEEATTHGVFGRCEFCCEFIWEGEQYAENADSHGLCCMKCYQQRTTEQP